VHVLRYAAFTTDPAGGNPAGVVLDAGGLTAAEMQRIAADVGFSETAFLVPTGPQSADVRYFAPRAEVPFCGHATIASGVARAALVGVGELTLASPVGPIHVTTRDGPDGVVATLVSVRPTVGTLGAAVADRLLAALRITRHDLDPELPVRVADAGNRHPVVAVARPTLDALDWDEAALAALMAEQGWPATVVVVARLGPHELEARNPFPPGGVREDPATGAGAAALGAYLRSLGRLVPPARLLVHQGRHVGRPARITVDVPAGGAGIAVSGTAVPMPAPATQPGPSA
jgi:PhzF family phenazine biosynthesis protein